VVKQLKNDVAFKTKDNRLIIMVEHQSTLNENMPLRFLLYYAELLKIYITQNEVNIFAKRAISIPKPEFFVVYNGEDPLKDTELFLKANLGGNDEFITMKVKIMDITYDHLPQKIKQRNAVVDGYSYFMDRIRFYHKLQKLLLEEAIQKAIEDTLLKGYLVEYLQRKEFVTMITKVLTIQEEIDLIRLEERQEGIEKGIEKGKIETVKAALEENLPIELIKKLTGLEKEKIEEIQTQLQKEYLH
jgi:hypothetical protein